MLGIHSLSLYGTMRSQFLPWDMESIKNFYANWTQNTTVMGLMTFALLLGSKYQEYVHDNT